MMTKSLYLLGAVLSLAIANAFAADSTITISGYVGITPARWRVSQKTLPST